MISRPGAGRGLRRPRSMVSRCTSPQWSGPSRVSRPGLRAMKVIVWLASKHGAQAAAGVGVEAAGDIDGEARAGLGVEGVDPGGVAAFQRALQADAEEGVHHQRPAFVRRCGQIGHGEAAGGDPRGCMGGAGVVGQTTGITGKGHAHRQTGAVQMPRDHEAVAAVVAGPQAEAPGPEPGRGAGQPSWAAAAPARSISGGLRRGWPALRRRGCRATG